MTLNIEYTKNGKPNILFNNHKYRESYTLKGGEIVWRCLGRTCSATVKTDPNKATVVEANSKHSGPHPVTMRSLSSPSASKISAPAPDTPPGPSAAESVVCCEPGLPRPSPPTTTADLAGTPLTTLPTLPSCSTSTPLPAVELENKVLKDEVSMLKGQLKTLLDHSIENDLRLLQYTDQVFVSGSSLDKPANDDCKVDTGIQCNIPSECQDARCTELKSLIIMLRTTIEVLEAENLSLKNASPCNCKPEMNKQNERDWVEVKSNKNVPLKVTNYYNVLSDSENCSHVQTKTNNKTNPSKKESKSCKQVNKARGSPHIKIITQKTLNFPVVNIESDSHGRYVDGLVQQLVDKRRTTVNGYCIPGAKLMSVIDGAQPPPGSCSVLIAGTNDLAEGQQKNIYRHLEHYIASRLKTSKVVVSTLPHRHDLPSAHIINEQVVLVNAYIEELCLRYPGVQVLDFNKIGRRFFTRHGLHLTMRGKRLLAQLILEALLKADKPKTPRPPPPQATTSSTPETTTPAEQSPMLSHESYADAVKSPTPAPSKTNRQNTQKNLSPMFTGRPSG